MKVSRQSNRLAQLFWYKPRCYMFLLLQSALFLLLSIRSKYKFELCVLSLLCFLMSINSVFFQVSEAERYIFRTFLMLGAGVILLTRTTLFSAYQAFILLLFLISNMCLMYDVSKNAHILIYNNFEAVIYGLVCCQFVGVLPQLWNNIRNWYTDRYISLKNKQVV